MDLLNELFEYVPNNDSAFLTVSSKGVNAINSIINLLEFIQTNFNETDSDYLKRKFLASIKSNNTAIFERSIQILYDKQNKETK